jgi:hypothetical protein
LGPPEKDLHIHFDVHLERDTRKFGAFYHSGSYMNIAIEYGLLYGKEVGKKYEALIWL